MIEETENTRETLTDLIEQKEPQSALYSVRLIVLICILVVISLFGLFYFLSNNSLMENVVGRKLQDSPSDVNISPIITASPKQARFEIITGALYRTLPGEQRKVLVTKDDLRSDVLEIVSYKVSPSMDNIVVMGNIGQTPYALFYKNLISGEVSFIDIGQDAAWSADDRYVALRKGKTDIGPYQVFVYDTQTKKMVETTSSKQLDPNSTSYGKLLWAADRPEIVAEYSVYGDYPYNLKEAGTVSIMVK